VDGSALETPVGVAGWVARNGQMVYFFVQIVYWFLTVLFLGYAVFQFKRWVNFQLGIGRSGQLRDAAEAKGTETISIDEFVE
jgi:hypothetical protein